MPVTPPRNSSRLRRWTLKITLALLAGAVVTWAVAWGCAMRRPWHNWSAGGTPDEDVQHVFTREGFNVALAFQRRHRTVDRWDVTWISPPGGPRSSVVPPGFNVTEAPEWLPDPVPFMTEAVVYGLPARSMFERSQLEFGAIPPVPVDPQAINTRLGRFPARILPLGFTLNTLLAAGVILTLTEGAGAWRRRARRRKGKCPWCGYDRAGVAVDAACPECGSVA